MLALEIPAPFRVPSSDHSLARPLLSEFRINNLFDSSGSGLLRGRELLHLRSLEFFRYLILAAASTVAW